MTMGLLVLLVYFNGINSLQAQDAQEYGLRNGAQAPEISTHDIHGQPFSLHQALKKGPVVLVFYRGGWCPYCNTQLRNLKKKLVPFTDKHGTQIVALSADRLDESIKSYKKDALPFTILSDPKLNIIKAYKLSYKVPAKLVKKYKDSYGIDLEAASGEKHHTIAVPAVMVINSKGLVTYAYANVDYKVRAPIEDVKAAVLVAKRGA